MLSLKEQVHRALMPEFIERLWVNWKLRSRLRLLGFTRSESDWSYEGSSYRHVSFNKDKFRVTFETHTYATNTHHIKIDDLMPRERATSEALRHALKILDATFIAESPDYFRFAALPLFRTLIKIFGYLFGAFIFVNAWIYVLDLIAGKNTIHQDLFATSVIGLIGAFHCVVWTKSWVIRGALLLLWIGALAAFVVLCLL